MDCDQQIQKMITKLNDDTYKLPLIFRLMARSADDPITIADKVVDDDLAALRSLLYECNRERYFSHNAK